MTAAEIEALMEGDRKHIARELADVVYVAYGTAHAFGIDLDVALAEIHRAAMSKLVGPGLPLVRADGKILKPPGFVSPDMTAALLAKASDPENCPECGSYSPSLHPAVQCEGEVIGCENSFHGEYRPRDGESLAEFSRRAYPRRGGRSDD